MGVQSAIREEESKLQETFAEIARQLAQIGPRYYGHDYEEQLLDEKRQENRQRLETLAREPYFGRLDYQESGNREATPLYIGKRGMEQADTVKPYIIDWRAPVASMFYSFTGGDEEISYDSPDGSITGWIHLKRNLAIHDRFLERVVDSYVRGGDNLGVTDEFLLYRLGENKDNRLRDIVSTIQAEQDAIIRAPKDRALIIQGAAGSGKTTVALHRLAYLLYRYRDEVRADNMVIFAPNAMFLDYISGVLPELGVGNIKQTTYVDWAIDLLGGDIRLVSDDHSRWFEHSDDSYQNTAETSGRYKGSLAFMRLVQERMILYQKQLAPKEDFVAWDGKVLLAETMREWFDGELARYPLTERKTRLEARIKRWLEIAIGEVAKLPHGNEWAKNARRKLQQYVKKLPTPDPLALYRMMFGINKSDMKGLDLRGIVPDEVYRATGTHLKANEAAQEDLAALLWIRIALSGVGGGLRFDHAVIDEAQDCSPFQVAVIRAHMKETSFTILGDLAQGIHEYRGIHSWEELYPIFEVEEIDYHTLRQSYRSTTEIIEFAAGILEETGTDLPLPLPVFRSGEPVRVERIEHEMTAAIVGFVQEAREKGMRMIAIITRTAGEARVLFERLAALEPNMTLLEENQTKYSGGLLILPAYLAKGLEFDAVLLPDVSKATYGPSMLEAKLLYVVCTRALHLLRLLYNGERSGWISMNM